MTDPTRHFARLEQALASGDPVEELRRYAIELSRQGLKRQAIYDLFHDFSKRLQDAGRTQDEDALGDVMDMISGYYVGRNLDLPE